MKNLIQHLFILVAFVLIGASAKAQTSTTANPTSYNFALGLKFGGYENGISGKYFMTDNTAIEGVLGFRSNGLVVSGLYELNTEAFNVPELKFYYGFGAHLGSVGAGTYQRFGGSAQVYHSSQILIGADGVIGLEYMIPQSPIAVSLDLNPRLELASGPFFDIAPGLGVKYFFK